MTPAKVPQSFAMPVAGPWVVISSVAGFWYPGWPLSRRSSSQLDYAVRGAESFKGSRQKQS